MLIYFCGYFTLPGLELVNAESTATACSALAFLFNVAFIFWGVHQFYLMKQEAASKLSMTAKRQLLEAHSNLGNRLSKFFMELGQKDAFDDLELVSQEEKKSGAYIGMNFTEFVTENPPGPRIAAWKTFLKSEYSDENIDFYLRVRQFRLDAGHDPNAPTIQLWEKTKRAPPLPDALKPTLQEITDIYIRAGADRQVNLPNRIRKAVVTCVEEDTCTTIVLDDALHEIIRLMGRDSFPRFQDSEHWQRLL